MTWTVWQTGAPVVVRGVSVHALPPEGSWSWPQPLLWPCLGGKKKQLIHPGHVIKSSWTRTGPELLHLCSIRHQILACKSKRCMKIQYVKPQECVFRMSRGYWQEAGLIFFFLLHSFYLHFKSPWWVCVFYTSHRVSTTSIVNPVLTQDIHSEIFVPDRWPSALSRNKGGLFVIEMRMLISCRWTGIHYYSFKETLRQPWCSLTRSRFRTTNVAGRKICGISMFVGEFDSNLYILIPCIFFYFS